MRIQIRFNMTSKEDQLIRRWLGRYHKGAQRKAVVRACLLNGARTFFHTQPDASEHAQDEHDGREDESPPPITIPSLVNLGQLLQNHGRTAPQIPPTRPAGQPHS